MWSNAQHAWFILSYRSYSSNEYRHTLTNTMIKQRFSVKFKILNIGLKIDVLPLEVSCVYLVLPPPPPPITLVTLGDLTRLFGISNDLFFMFSLSNDLWLLLTAIGMMASSSLRETGSSLESATPAHWGTVMMAQCMKSGPRCINLVLNIMITLLWIF